MSANVEVSAAADSPARDLIGFLHGMAIEQLPAKVVADARWCLLDSLGCGVFGSQQEWSRILADEMLAEGARGASSIVGRREILAAPGAALCNGTAIHGFELDDLLDEAIVHPGAVIIPAALAAAEAVDACGARLLLGIIAGYETMNRVGLAVGLEPALRGFHKTAVVGPVGGAVAAGVVMNLPVDQLMLAVGLACSTASGTKSFAAGTGGGMMKRMHAGRAAESGVRMAQLAARGFTSPPSALDGRFGLLEVFGGEGARAALLATDLGRNWAVEEVFVKVFPCCSWIQATVQQLLALRGAGPVAPAQVAAVRVGVNSYAIRSNGQVAPPDTMGAQYSLPYCAALALAGDPHDPQSYRGAAIDDPARRELARRVELVVDPQMEAAYPKHYGARVELALAGAPMKSSIVLDPHGMPADPVTESERVAKFARLAGSCLSVDAIETVTCMVRDAQRLPSVRALTAALRA